MMMMTIFLPGSEVVPFWRWGGKQTEGVFQGVVVSSVQGVEFGRISNHQVAATSKMGGR